jgi:hypothetical protein
MEQTIKKLLNNALNIYEYGSIIYGTYIEGKSDYDYIVIVPDDYDTDKQIEYNNCHYNIFHLSNWLIKLEHHDVDAIETLFLPEQHIIKEEIKFEIVIDPIKLRESFSCMASHSWVKCKKKLILDSIDYNPYIAKKSLWHSLRIIDFGTQIYHTGRINNYSSMNQFYDEIINNSINDWDYYQLKYKPIYNKMKTEFRIAQKQYKSQIT